MKTSTKVILAVVVLALLAVIYYYYKKTKQEVLLLPTIKTKANESGRSVGGSTATETVLQRWIVKGKPDENTGYCPMGQAKIWDGNKWVCCVSDK